MVLGGGVAWGGHGRAGSIRHHGHVRCGGWHLVGNAQDVHSQNPENDRGQPQQQGHGMSPGRSSPDKR